MTVENVNDLPKLSGFLLIASVFIALVIYNSPLAGFYDSTLDTHLTIKFGEFGLDKSLLHWINDGLMVLFFLLVGLEIKKEIVAGDLSSVKKAPLPVLAALGGVIAPALIYSYINAGDAIAMKGWAVPVATDIAFAVGILAMLGNRVPRQIKIILLSLAIIDDLAAILIIALFYTDTISIPYLGLAGLGLLAAFICNRMNVRNLTPYALAGVFLWFFMVKSGVHATLAGVALAFMIPMRTEQGVASPLQKMEHGLHSWVNLLIIPVFAFANSGVSFAGFSMETLQSPITLGIILGLFFGKQVGVFFTIWICDLLGISKKPSQTSWAQIYGMAILTGVGFTMSLFIGSLSFVTDDLSAQMRLGVLAASLLAAVVGYIFLSLVCKPVAAVTAKPKKPVQKRRKKRKIAR